MESGDSNIRILLNKYKLVTVANFKYSYSLHVHINTKLYSVSGQHNCLGIDFAIKLRQ